MNHRNNRKDHSKKYNIWEERYYDIKEKKNRRREIVKQSFDKIISIMRDKKLHEIIIERKYLIEIVEEKFLVLSRKDSLPILKAFVREAFKYYGIDVKYYKDLIKF